MSMSPRGVLLLVIVVLFVAAAVPIAINTFNDTDTTTWTPGEIAMWGILGIVVLGTVILGLTGKLGSGRGE